MKTDIEGLRELYKSRILDQTRIERQSCPTPEELSASLRGRTSHKKKQEIVEHLTRCYFCTQEFQFILETQRYEKKLIQDFGIKGIQVFLKNWTYARAATAVFLVLALSASLYIAISGRQKFRGVKIRAIKLIQPGHKKTTVPMVFRWRGLPNAQFYILELFDETLYPIWKSERIHKNEIQLPEEIAHTLSPDKSYYWFVTGFLSQDRKIESPLERFQIKK